MRRLDPDRTPQELQPARVPTVLVFLIGTLAWVAALGVVGTRHLLGHGLDPHEPWIATVGIGLGLLGMLWGRVHDRREAQRAAARARRSTTPASPATTPAASPPATDTPPAGTPPASPPATSTPPTPPNRTEDP